MLLTAMIWNGLKALATRVLSATKQSANTAHLSDTIYRGKKHQVGVSNHPITLYSASYSPPPDFEPRVPVHRDFHNGVYRPFANLPTTLLLENIKDWANHRVDLYTLAINEVEGRELTGHEAQQFDYLKAHAPLKCIPWLNDAAVAMASINRNSEGRHNVYIVLLHGHPDGSKPGGNALYLGETGKHPQERFWRHKKGISGSRHVRRWGVRLLPYLYEHINPLDEQEAKNYMERHIHDSLFRVGVPVVGHVGPMDFYKL